MRTAKYPILFIVFAAMWLIQLCTVNRAWCDEQQDTCLSEMDNEIRLGMSTALSGPTAELGLRMRAGVELALQRCNYAGGIGGRKVTLISYDDGYEPYRVADNMTRLIEHDKVLAIIGNVGTPTAIAALPIIQQQQVLFFAPFTGAGLLRATPPQHYVINYRASYRQEIDAMVDALIDIGKLRPDQIAFFTQRDGYGDAGYVSGYAALKRHGLKDDRGILHVRYDRNTLAVENALADILLSRQDTRAIIMVGAYAPCAKFIRLARKSGLDALFLNVSFVSSDLLLRKLGSSNARVLVTQVVPPLDSAVPIVAQYSEDLHRFTPQHVADYVGLEGYISTRLLLHALATIPNEITRENIITALEQLGTCDIGVGVPLKLSKKQHQACQQVWLTELRNGKTVSINWQHIGKLLSRKDVP